jgi:hypothetical protein
LTERSPGFSPSKSNWSRHAEPVSPPDLLPLTALTRASESWFRLPSAALVQRSRHELILRRIEEPPYTVFGIRSALSQSCEIASSLALGSLVEFEPTPLVRTTSPSSHEAPEAVHYVLRIAPSNAPPSSASNSSNRLSSPRSEDRREAHRLASLPLESLPPLETALNLRRDRQLFLDATPNNRASSFETNQ